MKTREEGATGKELMKTNVAIMETVAMEKTEMNTMKRKAREAGWSECGATKKVAVEKQMEGAVTFTEASMPSWQ